MHVLKYNSLTSSQLHRDIKLTNIFIGASTFSGVESILDTDIISLDGKGDCKSTSPALNSRFTT